MNDTASTPVVPDAEPAASREAATARSMTKHDIP